MEGSEAAGIEDRTLDRNYPDKHSRAQLRPRRYVGIQVGR
jgi:hypothetical protein